MADPGDFLIQNPVECHSWVQMTGIPQNFPYTYKPGDARTITISTLNLVRFSPGAAFIPAIKGNIIINFYLIINKTRTKAINVLFHFQLIPGLINEINLVIFCCWSIVFLTRANTMEYFGQKELCIKALLCQ